MDQSYKAAAELLLGSEKIVLFAHRNPDGDSLGGAIALAMALQDLGKDAQVLCESDTPSNLAFLPDVEKVQKTQSSSGDLHIVLEGAGENLGNLKYKKEGNDVRIVISPENGSLDASIVNASSDSLDADLLVTVDCGDLQQLGKNYDRYKSDLNSKRLLNIDHHISNTEFGTDLLVDTAKTSSCEVLLDLLDIMAREKMLIDERIATCLFTGIISDTGSFMNTNTTEDSLRNASRLLSLGADHDTVVKNLYKTNPLGLLKMWGELFNRIVTVPEAKMLYVWVTDEDCERYGLPYGENGGIMDKFLTSVPDFNIVVLFTERRKEGRLEISSRSPNSSINLYKFMERMGGGGHMVAAGCKIPCDDVTAKREEMIRLLTEYALSDEAQIVKEKTELPEVKVATEITEELAEVEEAIEDTHIIAEAVNVPNDNELHVDSKQEIAHEIEKKVQQKAPEVFQSSRRRRREASGLSSLASNLELKELPADHPLRKLDSENNI